jgi:two-component system, sensor histidine kinase and response regulator
MMNNSNSTPGSTPGSTTDEARVGAEQIRVFYAQTNTALLGNLLAVIATLVLLWDRVDQDYLKIWSGVTGALVLFRLVIYRGFNADPENVEAIRGWGPIFTAYTLVSGLCWGALSGVFFDIRDPFVPIYIVCVVAGLLVGALGTLSAHAPAYRAFVVAMVFPLIARCLLSGMTDYMIIGGLVGFALAASLKFGANWERSLKDRIRNRLETEALLAAVERNRDALAKSEQRLAAIIDNSPASIFLKDLDGGYLLTNRALQQRQGFTAAEMIGMTAHDHFPPDVADRITMLEKEVIAVDDSIEREIEVPQPDGGSYIGLTAKFPIHDLDGTITGVGTITTNITQRKNAEEALRESERRVTAILQASPIGVSILSEWSGGRIFVNKALMDQFGVTSAEDLKEASVGESWRDPEDYEYVKNISAVGETITNFVAPRKRSDGTIWWALHNSVKLVFEGEPSRVVWHTDITQSKQAEEEIRASEARLRGLLENSPVGVAVNRADGKILFANSRYAEMMGLEEGDIAGLNAASLYVFEDRREEMVEELDLIGRISDELIEHRRADGSTFWALISGEMIDFQGERAILSWAYDIDERVRMETLLQSAKDEAEAASRAKSSFLAAMSHEIRTPMNGVLGMIEVLQQSALTDDQRSVTGTIQESAVGLLTIIDDILDFSKIEAGRLELEAVPVTPRTVLEGVLDIIAPDVERKGLDLALVIDDDVPNAILGDPIRLRQILLNLVGNAAKFTEAGSIEVTVGIEALENADSDGRGDGPILKFSVIDTGIGISEARQSGLFQAFSQAETSTTRRFGGTGLGLSICARLVELMGGEIGIDSREGEGATFWFRLPVEPVNAPKSPSEHAQGLSGVSVLVVEESDPIRRMIASILASAGIDVTAVDTVLDAANLVTDRGGDNAGFDVLIVDGRVRDLETSDLAGYFRIPSEQPSARAIRLHAAGAADQSATNEDQDRVFHLEVSRPVRRDSLLCAIAVVLGRASPDLPAVDEDQIIATSVAPVPDVELALEQGRLILIAEDNATNREVIQRQLHLLGFAAEVAEDGAIAFDMWRQRSYGLVVSDCHMPNIDGFELTAMIRDVERELGTHTPIVALTANALVGEAERCLNAGMDDYLAKPVGLKKLRQTLVRWLPDPMNGTSGLYGSPAEQTDAPVVSDDPSSPVDLSILTELFGDDRDGIHEMMALFLENADRLVDEIDSAIKADDAASLSRASHGLKGAANAIGVLLVGEVARDLEEAGRDEDMAKVREDHPRLATSLEAARAFIDGY